jgi:hypothetical protein
MNPTRPKSDARPRRQWVCPQAAASAAILLRRKLLINSHYSRCSSFSRLIDTKIRSCTQGSAGTYGHVYIESARHPAAPAVTLSFQWDKRSRRAAAHPETCCAYHHRTIETAHSPAATPPGPESVEGCAIAPPLPITPKVITSLPRVCAPVLRPYERRASTSLNPYPKSPTSCRDHPHPCSPSAGRGFVV